MKKKPCEMCLRPWGEHTIANIGRRLEWICPAPKRLTT